MYRSFKSNTLLDAIRVSIMFSRPGDIKIARKKNTMYMQDIKSLINGIDVVSNQVDVGFLRKVTKIMIGSTDDDRTIVQIYRVYRSHDKASCTYWCNIESCRSILRCREWSSPLTTNPNPNPKTRKKKGRKCELERVISVLVARSSTLRVIGSPRQDSRATRSGTIHRQLRSGVRERCLFICRS